MDVKLMLTEKEIPASYADRGVPLCLRCTPWDIALPLMPRAILTFLPTVPC
jgi:hypothetical protein